MSELLAFLCGIALVAPPLLVLYLRERESRKYFERDRDSMEKIARQLRQTLDERELRSKPWQP